MSKFYLCEVCGKEFLSPQSLTFHLKTHNNIKSNTIQSIPIQSSNINTIQDNLPKENIYKKEENNIKIKEEEEEKKQENIILQDKKINRQLLFIEYYLNPASDTHLNAYRSAIKSGYSDKTARIIINQLKHNKYQKIRDKILEISNETAKKITPDYILGKLNEIIDVLSHPEKVADHPILKKTNVSDIVKSLELCGKYLKMFSDTLNINSNSVFEIRIVPPVQDKKVIETTNFEVLSPEGKLKEEKIAINSKENGAILKENEQIKESIPAG